MTGNASPTLTMRIAAPEVLAGFAAMRKEAEALKLSLAGLQQTGGRGGFARMQAEVNELKAALASARLENEKLAAAVDQKAQRTTAAAARETAAVQRAAQEQTRATQAALVEQEAAAERSAARRLALQVNSGKMTSDLTLRRNAAVEASLAQHLSNQERMRDRALDQEFRAVQAATARNERLNEQARARNLRAVQQDLNLAHAEALRMDRLRTTAAGAAGGGGAGDGGMGRSLARGVAGSGGALFLTYGQSIPALAAGYVGGAMTRETVQRGSEFSYQTQFAGALGDMTPEGIAKMREEIRKLGTDSIYGPIELAKGMRVLQQAGVDAGDAMKILPVSMKVAQQGETDLTKASESLVGIMRQFKLSIGDVPAIGDALSKTAAVTQANIPQLMEALKAATGLSAYGVDLNQSLANIGLLAKQGITGSSAGTFFRRFVEDIYTPKSQGAMRAQREIGFSPYGQDGSLRPFRDVQEEFTTKLQGFTPESQIKLLGQMMDIRGLKDANALISDMSGEFTTLRSKIDQSKGSLDDFAKAMSGETKNVWAQVKSNFEGVLIDAFASIGPSLNALLKDMRDFFKDEAVTSFLKVLLMIPKGYVDIVNTVGMIRKGNQTDAPFDRQAARERFDANESPFAITSAGPDYRSLSRGRRQALNADAQVQLSAQTLAAGNAVASSLSGVADPFSFDPSKLGAPYSRGPKKQASLRVRNSLEFKDQQQMADALEQEAMSRMRRERTAIEQEATFAQRVAEEKHRTGLISEQEYTRQIDQINDKRALDAVIAANNELEVLDGTMQTQATQAEKFRTKTKMAEVAAQRDRLRAEADFQKDLARTRNEGKAKQLADETSKIMEGFSRAEQFRVEQRDLQFSLPFMRPGQAAEATARFDAQQRFAPELLNVDEAIKKTGPGSDLEALKKRREEILRLRDVMVRLQGDEARLRVERERTWGHGQQTALRQWVDEATDGARQAREVWTTGLNGMASALTRFVMTGKLQFRDLAASIIEMLVRVRIERGLAGLVDKFIGNGGNVAEVVGAEGAGGSFGGIVVHSGGVLGRENHVMRAAPASLWDHAPRMHSGGMVGAGEMPIIARYGEGVFTPEQMRNLAPASGPQAVRVELVNKGTPQRATGATTQFDGKGMFVRIVTEDLRVNGPIAQALESTYDVQRGG